MAKEVSIEATKEDGRLKISAEIPDQQEDEYIKAFGVQNSAALDESATYLIEGQCEISEEGFAPAIFKNGAGVIWIGKDAAGEVQYFKCYARNAESLILGAINIDDPEISE